MRIGNHNLQRDALAAASPLFPSAGKSNYAVAIAQHLSTLTKYPKLNEILQHVGAFRIPKNIDDDGSENQKPVCLRFDEALETFGVHFIKQNISGNIIDEMKLKANIKAAQSERERVDLLLSEYLENTSISQSERAINSRRKALWELVEDLVMIFDMTDPLLHQIFKDLKPPEIHKTGYEKLLACYENGLERMQIIYKQDVIKSEPRNAQGRRALEVRQTKYKDYAETKRNEREAKRIEREIQRRDKIPLNNDQPEVCCMRKILCGLKSCLILLHICHFSYMLMTIITRLPKDEEKYLRMKSKYWNVCWFMKRFQAIYMMRRFNYLELNGIRKGYMVGGIIVLINNN
ncbi:hypothetical protein RhiirC2_830782 [Rhizophagus irregularis]|uniref:Uncharacterized protein n=1 Tax=Rhizophagus irregularis TaxID=588596 RepID=A0A2N1N8E3_9GLOM|nr:hypothetical protein RhiirC2_830782 [Rhizophagus irregularis]